VLRGKKVLLGVCGGIAAYKSPFLVRLLIKAGAEVKVVLSPAARDFVTPLTLATLSKHPVYWSFFEADDDSGQWHNHVELGLWADLMLIAPATANTLAKMAQAQSDNFLLACYLSAKCPVYVAPAMDRDMYQHPANQDNLQRLAEFGHHVIPAESGELASGLEGQGRMAEPEHIRDFIEAQLKAEQPWRGKRVLITAGPTYEAIDPVRFLGNRSSGKMGLALAEAALAKGAEVALILGPSSLSPAPEIELERVESAREMLAAAEKRFPQADLAIFAAAVADYRPRETFPRKRKKVGENLVLELMENPDILTTLAAQKKTRQTVVGFALETDAPESNARKKLDKKNADLIVLNEPNAAEGSGFGTDTNAVKLISKNRETKTLTLKAKSEIAFEILDFVGEHFMA